MSGVWWCKVALTVVFLILVIACFVAIFTSDLPTGVAGGAAMGWLLAAEHLWED